VLTGSKLPCAGAEAEQGDELFAGENVVADLTAGQRRIAQVVVALDVLVPEPGLRAIGDWQQAQRRQVVDGGREQGLGIGGGGGWEVRRAAEPVRNFVCEA